MLQRLTQPEVIATLAAAGIGVGARTFRRLESAGLGPRRTSIGKRVFYAVEDLEVWLASRTAPRPAADRPEMPRRPKPEAAMTRA